MDLSGVAEANRDSLLYRGRSSLGSSCETAASSLDHHVGDRRISFQSGGHNVDFDAGAEDVLQSGARQRSFLRELLDKKDIPAFLREIRCLLHSEANHLARSGLD